MGESNEYRIKVIDKMFKIIDILEKENEPLGVNEISRKAQINVTTTFRILKALIENGWAYQDKEGRCSPGYRLCSFYTMGKFYYILKDVSFGIMQQLTKQEGKVLNLCVRQNETGVLLQQTRIPRFVDYVMQVDSILPLYATACGKVLLSEMPEEVLCPLIECMDFHPYTELTITEPEKLKDDLKRVKERGYAMDVGESLRNTCCIAVPVRGMSGEIIAGLSFSGLQDNLPYDGEIYHYHLLEKASEEITDQMFHVYKGNIPPNG